MEERDRFRTEELQSLASKLQNERQLRTEANARLEELKAKVGDLEAKYAQELLHYKEAYRAKEDELQHHQDTIDRRVETVLIIRPTFFRRSTSGSK
jgi:hypothetical protein